MQISGQIELGPEPPDFLIHANGKTIAVEITEYHQPLRTQQGHTRREVEAAWQRIREHVVTYREDKKDLDNLSVRLEFVSLSVPSTKERAAFVDAVHEKIKAVEKTISKKSNRMLIEDSDPAILRQYLKCVRVRSVSCYMEWDWNHDFAGIGTSDDEMMLAIGGKLRHYVPPKEIDENHLVIRGWGGRLSEIAAPVHEEQLASFRELNQALEASAFDCVAILDLRDFVWRRGAGWVSLQERASVD
jgi:hypothetical protein